MEKPSHRPARPLVGLVGTALACAALLDTGSASAEAEPAPESPYRSHERAAPEEEEPRAEWSPRPDARGSLFRFGVGPAMLLAPVNPGLLTSLDIGRQAVGARLSASFLRAESDQGLAAYTAELWVDFGHRYQLHPLLGAGASLLHGGALGRQGSSGAGVLRGGLEYELPLDEADARVGLNVIGLVPAIASDRSRPWFLGSVTIGAGF